MNILFLSETPVAGTFDRIVDAVRQFSDHNVKALTLNSPKRYAFNFKYGPLRLNPNWKSILIDHIRPADCIIIQNMQSSQYLSLVFECKTENCITVYQNHSPPLEGPQYFYSVLSNYKFDFKTSIGQGHGRFQQFDRLLPNIIRDNELIHQNSQEAKNWIFTPTVGIGRSK